MSIKSPGTGSRMTLVTHLALVVTVRVRLAALWLTGIAGRPCLSGWNTDELAIFAGSPFSPEQFEAPNIADKTPRIDKATTMLFILHFQ
jgi:hypothetical protein